MVGAVVGDFRGVFLKAENTSAFDAILHIFDAVYRRKIRPEDRPLLLVQPRVDAVEVRTRKHPRPHREVLKHMQTLANPLLYPHHAAKLSVNFLYFQLNVIYITVICVKFYQVPSQKKKEIKFLSEPPEVEFMSFFNRSEILKDNELF